MKSFVMTGVVLLGFLTGCASGPAVSYQDPNAVETLTADFGTTDVQMITDKMVSSLLETPIFGSDRPVIWVSPLRNKTSEHIDTKMITDRIRTALLKSGKVRFTAASDIPKELQKQISYQNESGIVDPSTAAGQARQIGAKFMLYGEVGSIVKQAGRTKLVDYQVTLNLTNVETGIIEWADEKTIRKGSTRQVFGR
ncbi:MAG: penicillin-binding protein activator LpoB [Actinomycetota bacterium]|nr:penicillin-binding protein activator LpoB [Actinomycetota bacterium]